MVDHEARVAKLIERLREKVPEDTEARGRLDQALARERTRRGTNRWLRSFATPRLMTVSPLAVSAAGVILLALGLAGGLSVSRSESPPLASTSPSPSTQLVSFVFFAADARSVVLVGDFNDWQAGATPLVRSGGDTWSAVVPLSPGRYTYSFVVDGTEWRPDPVAPPAPEEEFGRPSSVVFVEES